MKITKSLLIISALGAIATISVIGCNKPIAPSTNTSKTSDMKTIVAHRNATGELICPVQGDVIKSVDDAAGFQDYEGKRYYFCCAGCPEKFAANPEMYAQQ